jgi:hypothetical protein
MKQSVQTAFSSTQAFTEIQDIVEDMVLFTTGHAALVIEVSPTNFALLSKEEQDARVGAYASFLNSLTFPIQILVVNKRVDISSYLLMLTTEINNNKNNPPAFSYMQQYKAFVEQLVKQNTVLDKKFYIIIPYSSLESGVTQTVIHAAGANKGDFLQNARIALHTKAEGVRNQLTRINLANRILETDALIALFAEQYGQIGDHHNLIQHVDTPVVTGGEGK